MSSDGAHLGVSADRALKTIIGGDPEPEPDERRSPDEMRAWILSAPTTDEFRAYMDAHEGAYTDADYGDCARVVARVILEAYLAEPSLASLPMDAEYDWEGDPDHGSQGMKPEFVRQHDLAYVMRERGLYDGIRGLGISGFQWGWAVNAARFCVEVEPQPNPAIMTVGGSDE